MVAVVAVAAAAVTDAMRTAIRMVLFCGIVACAGCAAVVAPPPQFTAPMTGGGGNDGGAGMGGGGNM